jgi:ElaB/YqjD/DUF883 family membrane-anchored ribosome-binding protein
MTHTERAEQALKKAGRSARKAGKEAGKAVANLTEAGREVAQEAREKLESGTQLAQDSLKEVRGATQRGLSALARRARCASLANRTRAYVQDNAATTVLVAVAVGFVAGQVMARSARS